VNFGGGFVVCCNTNKTACAGSSFNGTGPGDAILKICVLEHEREHFKHIDCPTGNKECETSRPGFKPGQDPGEGECDAYKVEIKCLEAQRGNCGGNQACIDRINGRITQVMTDPGTGVKPGCFTP
jgi:hypothetical protein